MKGNPMKYPARLIHLSTDNLDGRTLIPRVPDSRLDNEDNTIKRVCFSSSIPGARRALPISSENEYFVHIPDCPMSELKPIRPTSKQVEDGMRNREWWVTRPVRMKCIGKVRFSLERDHYWYTRDITAIEDSQKKTKPPVWCELTQSDSEVAEINLISRVLSSKVHRSPTALMKIRHLIHTSYGGLVTDKEWKDTSNPVYTIYKDRRCKTLYVGKTCAKTPISFHTKGQAKLFLSRPENEQLVFDYLS